MTVKRTEIRYSRHSKNHRVVDALGQPKFQAMAGIKMAVAALAEKTCQAKTGRMGLNRPGFFTAWQTRIYNLSHDNDLRTPFHAMAARFLIALIFILWATVLL
jgi:hypothetical protein